MNDDEHPPNFNPVVSFSLHDTQHDGCGMLLHFLDPDAMAVGAEVRFDDPAVLAATIETTMSALKVLLTARQHASKPPSKPMASAPASRSRISPTWN